MSDTKVRVRKATMLLRDDHKKVKKLVSSCQKLDAAEDAERMQLFEQIKKDLGLHTQIEEEIFYPAVRRAPQEGASELVQQALEEHRMVKTLIDEISGLSPSDETFASKMEVLQESLFNHIRKEEDEIFPIFGELDKQDQTRVSEQMDSRRRELTEEQ
jgi:hemerythrin superfamily protein